MTFMHDSTKNTARTIGAHGEELACQYLKSQGWTIVKRNFYVNHLEIDIIAQKEQVISFIEVKSRKFYPNSAFGTPAEAVNSAKKRNIARAAELYLLSNPIDPSLEVNLDIIEVYLSTDSMHAVKLNHYRNAYTA